MLFCSFLFKRNLLLTAAARIIIPSESLGCGMCVYLKKKKKAFKKIQ